MFLPRISLLLAFLVVSAAGCDEPTRSARPRVDVARVVAGVGDVDAEVVRRTEEVVAVELADLLRVFDGLEPARFFVHVHASRKEMPEALAAGAHEDAPGFALLGRHQLHLVPT